VGGDARGRIAARWTDLDQSGGKLSRPGLVDADENPVGAQEVLDRGALLEEFGVRRDRGLGVEQHPERVHRPGEDGAANSENPTPRLRRERFGHPAGGVLDEAEVDRAVLTRRRLHGEEDHVRFCDPSQVARCLEGSVAEDRGEQLRQAGLVERRLLGRRTQAPGRSAPTTR
jgi:hypothetical protein